MKKRSQRKPKPQAGAAIDADESRPAVAVTVAWMLTTLSSAAAQLVAGGMWLVARNVNVPPGRPNALYLIPQTLLLVAIVASIAVLGLTPLVYRIRRARPPLAITILAVVVALLPLVTMVGLAVVFRLTNDQGALRQTGAEG